MGRWVVRQMDNKATIMIVLGIVSFGESNFFLNSHQSCNLHTWYGGQSGWSAWKHIYFVKLWGCHGLFFVSTELRNGDNSVDIDFAWEDFMSCFLYPQSDSGSSAEKSGSDPTPQIPQLSATPAPKPKPKKGNTVHSLIFIMDHMLSTTLIFST